MRHGLWRTLSALVSGTAFAVTVAGPVQWDPCPMHGASVHAETPPPAAIAAMPMAAGETMPVAVHAHATHGAPESNHAAHQCTCPGGCCSSTPVGLSAPSLSAPLALHVDVPSRVAEPADAIDRAPNPQIALPFSHAPPASGLTLQSAAHSLT